MRPLVLAVNAARIVGALCLLPGVFGLISVTDIIRMSNAHWTIWSILVELIPLSFLAMGAAYYTFAFNIKRKRAWAVIATILLASVHGLLVLFGLLRILAVGSEGIIGVIILSPFVAALALLIVYCCQSLRALPQLGMSQTRGFAPVMTVRQPSDDAETKSGPG
jgi:hypothetical protein